MNYQYCPNCGQPLTKRNDTLYECQHCGQQLWNNPKATVAVVFLKEGEALFSKRNVNPDKGKYDFPGGFLEYNEDVYDACVREVAEEMHVVISKTDLRFITAYSGEYIPGVSVLDLVFVITQWQGRPQADDDSAALEWKPLDFIDNPEFVPPYTGLAKLLAAYRA